MTPAEIEQAYEETDLNEQHACKYVPQETLYAIMARDPDGGSVEPTRAMYDAFRLWVILGYGLEVWKVYQAGGWAQDRTEGDWSHHYEDYGD